MEICCNGARQSLFIGFYIFHGAIVRSSAHCRTSCDCMVKIYHNCNIKYSLKYTTIFHQNFKNLFFKRFRYLFQFPVLEESGFALIRLGCVIRRKCLR